MSEPTDPDSELLDEIFSSLTPDWTAETVDTSGVRTVTVPTTTLLGDALYGKLRGVAIDQGTNCVIRFVFTHPGTGAPMKFTVGAYSTSPTIQVKYREATGNPPTVYVPDTGSEGSLAADGTYVLLPIPTEVKDLSAVYRAQTRLLDGDGAEMARDEFLVMTQRGMWTSDGSTPDDKGIPSVLEVRNVLRDHPAANRLLGNFEFDLSEIAQALVAAVDTYNQEFPQARPFFNTMNWPVGWRRQWLDGAAAFLFETAATYARRGSLPYAAGGVTINDLAKEKELLGAAQMYRERFLRWSRMKKAQISINAGFGSQGSGMGAGTNW